MVETETELLQKISIKKPKFEIIILSTIFDKMGAEYQILGRKLSEWIACACHPNKTRILSYDKIKNPSILDFIRKNIDHEYEYTIVLLSSTPLIEHDTISRIMEYVAIKHSLMCKLPVGFVINNAQESNLPDSIYSQDIDNFYVVENKKQLNYAYNILQERINNFHISNGVEIVKPKSVYIEPDVDIDGGVIIYANNTIKGKSIIASGTILKENNVIDNSIMGTDGCISSSVITNSNIGDSVYISSFCEIINASIASNSTIGSHSCIYNKKIKKPSKIEPNTILGDNK